MPTTWLVPCCAALLILLVQDADVPTASQPASAPARTTDTEASLRRPEQARILEQLIRDAERPRPIIPESTPGLPQAEARDASGLLLEGTMLVERAGRLIRSADRASFEFKLESDATARTLQILPNAWLEAMEREATGGTGEFIVTAEVMRYRGENYLLLRKVRRQIAHGNLSP